MPHLVDKETGLCVVCQRHDIAAIKEGKKFKRKEFDIRKLAIECMSDRNDPNYKEILDRYYIKSEEVNGKSVEIAYEKELSSNIVLSDSLPVKSKLRKEANNTIHSIEESNSSSVYRQNSKNNWRDTLRKINISSVANSDLVSEDKIKPVYETAVKPFVIEKLVGETVPLKPIIREKIVKEPLIIPKIVPHNIETRVVTREPVETKIIRRESSRLKNRVIATPLTEVNIENIPRKASSLTEMDKRSSLNIDRSTGIPIVRILDPQTNNIVSPSDLKYEDTTNRAKNVNIQNQKTFDRSTLEVHSASTISYDSEILPQNKKLLSGFHPHYDEQSDTIMLQCCTCCIGCWRGCSSRCSGCENFISCPIYCWVSVLLPIFLLFLIALILAALYNANVF